MEVEEDTKPDYQTLVTQEQELTEQLEEAERLFALQPTDALDPDYNADAIAEFEDQITTLQEGLKVVQSSIEEAEYNAAVYIQGLWRTREAQHTFHKMLQNNFEKVYDHNSGAYFYYNKKTGETNWDKPKCMKDDPFAEDIEEVKEIGRPSGFTEDEIERQEREFAEREEARRITAEEERLRMHSRLRLEEWPVVDVVEWVDKVTLPQFGYGWKESALSAFENNQISGAVLASLEADDYRELGVASGLHIKRMMVKLASIKRHDERHQRQLESGIVEEYSSSSEEEYDDDDIDDDDEDHSGSDEGADDDSGSDDDSGDELTEEEIRELKEDEENLKIEEIYPGDHQRYPQKGEIIRLHYTAFLPNGQQFDSTRERGAPFEFVLGLGQVVKGMDRVIPKMSAGERAMVTMKPKYAYGAQGLPPVIPSHSTLKFDIEIISWRSQPIWEKPLIMAEEDLLESDRDLYFWKPDSLADDDPDLDNYASD